ncbi:MAG: D-Ala-D-Ala carboxypeptidase family metallohydrolase [Parabacteroides sp.]|nr:D-Ala-D-Ala carboxypeptidase family metallohydrolase [Parabacteroides sp.]
MRYFNYQEFEDSATARRDGIDNSLTPAAQRMVAILVEQLLDPLRQVWGRPIVISSGYRCPELNTRIGGVRHSHHLLGCAADLIAGSPTDHRRLFRLAQEMHERYGLRFTQLILEPGARWIHLSYVPGNLRCQVIDKEVPLDPPKSIGPRT